MLIVMDGTGNILVGGSGNDTLIGYASDTFDGGSGHNQITTSPDPIIASVSAVFSPVEDGRWTVYFSGTGLKAGSEVTMDVYYIDDSFYIDYLLGHADSNGDFSFDYGMILCNYSDNMVVHGVAADGSPVSYTAYTPC